MRYKAWKWLYNVMKVVLTVERIGMKLFQAQFETAKEV